MCGDTSRTLDPRCGSFVGRFAVKNYASGGHSSCELTSLGRKARRNLASDSTPRHRDLRPVLHGVAFFQLILNSPTSAIVATSSAIEETKTPTDGLRMSLPSERVSVTRNDSIVCTSSERDECSTCESEHQNQNLGNLRNNAKASRRLRPRFFWGSRTS